MPPLDLAKFWLLTTVEILVSAMLCIFWGLILSLLALSVNARLSTEMFKMCDLSKDILERDMLLVAPALTWSQKSFEICAPHNVHGVE